MLRLIRLAFLFGDVSLTLDKGMVSGCDVAVNIDILCFHFSLKKTTAEASEEDAQTRPRGFTKAELVARRLKRKQDRRVLKLMKEGVWITTVLANSVNQ